MDCIGISSTCNLPCLERSKDDYNFHQKKSGRHAIFKVKQFQQQSSNFFNFCDLKIWQSAQKQLQNYFASVRQNIRNAELNALQNIQKLKIKTALNTSNQKLLQIGTNLYDKRYKTLQCSDISLFLDCLKNNKIDEKVVTKNISDFLYQIQAKIQKILKNQIVLNTRINLSDSDLNMLRNFDKKNEINVSNDISREMGRTGRRRRYQDEDDVKKQTNAKDIYQKPKTNYPSQKQTNQRRGQKPTSRYQDQRYRKYRNQQRRDQNDYNRQKNQQRKDRNNYNRERGQRAPNQKRYNDQPNQRNYRGNERNREENNNHQRSERHPNHPEKRQQRQERDQQGSKLTTIKEISQSSGGKFTVRIKVLKICDKFNIRGSNKVQIQGGDKSGYSQFVLDDKPIIKDLEFLQITQCYVFVFRGKKQIQSSQKSQIRVTRDRFQVSTDFNFSFRRNRNPNNRRNFGRNNNRREQRGQQRENESERGDRRPGRRMNNDKNYKLIKISQIGPSQEDICIQAQVYKIIKITENHIKCQLGDQSGTIDALLPSRFNFVRQDVSIKLLNAYADVIQGHIILTLQQQQARIQRINKQFKLINIGVNISSKEWEEVSD